MIGNAYAEIVIVVAHENKLESLSRAELENIYLGKMNTLPDGQSVEPVDQQENSHIRHQFYRDFIKRTSTQMKMHWSKLIFSGRGQPPRTVPGDKAMAEFVAEHPNAIGYLSTDQVDNRLRVVPIE
jgi:ABC-type phosphate transport system substrate-binding protein